jgi:hypothetical protein
LLSLGIGSGDENVRRLGGFPPRAFPMYIPLLHMGILDWGNRVSGGKSNFLLVIDLFIHMNQEEEARLQVDLNQHVMSKESVDNFELCPHSHTHTYKR